MSTSSVYSDRMRCQSNANYKINIINQTWQLDTTQLKLGFVQWPDFDSTLQNPGSTTTHDPMTLWPYDPMIPWPMSFAKHINQFLECLFKKQHLWLHSNDSTSQLHHIISLQENISSMADRQRSLCSIWITAASTWCCAILKSWIACIFAMNIHTPSSMTYFIRCIFRGGASFTIFG